MRRLLLLALLIAGSAAAGASCSVHSLDYLSSGYTPDPPLPPDSPAVPPPPARDAGAVADAPAPAERPAPPAPPLPPAPPDAAADLPDAGGNAEVAVVVPHLYFIVGNLPLAAADAVLEQHLRARGLRITLVHDDVLASVDTGGADLVLISSTVSVMNVGARFRDVAKPVVTAEPLLYDDLGMVDGMVAMGVNRGVEPMVTTLSIVDPASPLAARLTGNVAIARESTAVSWGVPNENAIRVASLFGQAGRLALLAYESGQRMPGLLAPARRVGLFLSDQSASVLTNEGFQLFDAAIDWALGRR